MSLHGLVSSGPSKFMLGSAVVCSTPRTVRHHHASRQEDTMQPHLCGSRVPSLDKWPAKRNQVDSDGADGGNSEPTGAPMRSDAWCRSTGKGW